MSSGDNNHTQSATLGIRAEVIAKHFDVHKRTVCLWAESGTIPCVRIGGALRFDMEAVLGAAR